MKKLSSNTRSNLVTYGIVVVAYAVMQALSATGRLSNSLTGQLIPICVYVCMAISLNLTVGILGELSLGHAGFMSVGAFAGAITAAAAQSLPDPLRLIFAILAGGVLAAIAGVIIGVPVLRLRGDYLAIVTLAFGEIIKNLMNIIYVGVDSHGVHFFAKLNETSAVDMALDNGAMIIKGAQGGVGAKIATFTAGFLLVLVVLTVTLNLINSRSGRAVMAIRDNRIAAESVGINVTKYKLMAFVISAAMAGMAGALFAMNISAVDFTKFDFNKSILVLVFVVLGGMGNIRGSIIAATVLYILPEALRGLDKFRMLIYAIVLILVMLVTNNPILKQGWTRVKEFAAFWRKKTGGAADE